MAARAGVRQHLQEDLAMADDCPMIPSESTREHQERARQFPPPSVAVLTISDTRNKATDKSGALILELLGTMVAPVVAYEVVPDDPPRISGIVQEWCARGDVEVILANGGTGIAPRDGTYEAVSALIERPLPGFGEIFRMISFQDIGPASMLSRAVGGLRGKTLIFSMPGSSNAVRTAMEKLILPELAHLVWEMKRRG